MLNLTQRIICAGIAYQELSAEFRRQLEAKKPVLIEALGGPDKVAYI